MSEIGRPRSHDTSDSNTALTQIRTYSHIDIAPSAVKETEVRRYGRLDWSKNMPTITRLYVDENRTLKEVKKIMETQYDFHATYAYHSSW